MWLRRLLSAPSLPQSSHPSSSGIFSRSRCSGVIWDVLYALRSLLFCEALSIEFDVPGRVGTML